jgi:hypothetical protein
LRFLTFQKRTVSHLQPISLLRRVARITGENIRDWTLFPFRIVVHPASRRTD